MERSGAGGASEAVRNVLQPLWARFQSWVVLMNPNNHLYYWSSIITFERFLCSSTGFHLYLFISLQVSVVKTKLKQNHNWSSSSSMFSSVIFGAQRFFPHQVFLFVYQHISLNRHKKKSFTRWYWCCVNCLEILYFTYNLNKDIFYVGSISCSRFRRLLYLASTFGAIFVLRHKPASSD